MSFLPTPTKLVRGHFVSEGKTRFKATVRVNGRERPCYVPFSSKLSSHVELGANPVRLSRRLTSEGEVLDLAWLKLGSKWSFVDLRQVNALVADCLFGHLSVEARPGAEVKVGDVYRADFADPATRELWEVKALLSATSRVSFPAMALERAGRQLATLVELQAQGWKVNLILVCLNPGLRSYQLNPKYQEFSAHFEQLLRGGTTVTGLAVHRRIGSDLPRLKWAKLDRV